MLERVGLDLGSGVGVEAVVPGPESGVPAARYQLQVGWRM